MQMYDIIEKKRDGHMLSREEIAFFIEGVTSGRIPDYQSAAFLMAAFLRGLSAEETFALTDAMAHSGDMLPKMEDAVDKHSTGGIGDTTTLVVLPLVMAAGKKMAKMSGRGLGFTGGTIDKLSAIPGFRTELSYAEFQKNLAEIGAVLASPDKKLAPADKILYALRDVTATVDSLPLIAASIMSKKLAQGAGKIVLDVKCGSGAFTKTEEDARALGRMMVEIGKMAGRDTSALITRMDAPLSPSVGNALEVIEAIETLKGKRGALLEVSLALASLLTDKTEAALFEYIENGTALDAFSRFVGAQGGDTHIIEDYSLFAKASFQKDIEILEDGYIMSMDAAAIGNAARILGAGRLTKEEEIDPAAGLVMHKKPGDAARGALCTLYTNTASALSEAEAKIRASICIGQEKPREKRIILERLS